ncbi:Bacterial flagellin N-terminal helical region [Gaiella occulta]|uniref:Flagellin n=1 Tax=Gaiella occulta TaxID=1002870 RepID=A0A7M2Z294_9ACTN|nr:flagellin [Gaiella occulta]RDI76012.1 Bacterial flagellin N-terminal helical region [Gaiella occulta]
MALRINNNVEAYTAHRWLVKTGDLLAKSSEKLSSGYRINRAADDAAGLGISQKMRAQIKGLEQASRNAQDGVSLVQTAEGALATVHEMLNRVRELAVQYNNNTLSAADKANITAEVKALGDEISRMGDQTKFNGIALLTGSATVTFQVGANDGEAISVTAGKLYGGDSTFKVDSGIFTFAATATLASIDTAIANVADLRASFGATQNRLEYAIQNLAVYRENLAASESRIRDLDVASEMVNFTKLQIMQQAGMSMLAQANTSPQAVLSLLR